MQGGYGQPASGLGRSQNPYMPSSGVPAYSSTSAGYGQSGVGGKGGMGQPMYQPQTMNQPAYGQPSGYKPAQFGPITPNIPPQQAPGQPPASFGPLAPNTQPPVNRPAPNLGLPVQMQPPSTSGMGYDKYRAITGDGFTGVRNGQNFVNGNLFAAEGLNQGDASNPLGAGFGNWLRAHQQYLGGTAASYVPPGGWR